MREGIRTLSDAGLDNAGLDTRVLLAHELGLEAGIVPLEAQRELTAGEIEGFEKKLERRIAREPVARITGEREFWSLPFAVNGDTLIPRPDSETLVGAVLKTISAEAGGRGLRLLDLGTGSGCLLLAILNELPEAAGTGTDIAEGALAAARANAHRLGLAGRTRFVRHDWHGEESMPGPAPFDVIVSNPPYIPDGDIPGLAPDVRDWDPVQALAGGPDGLRDYGRIAALAAKWLAPGGWLFLEHGAGQETAVTEKLRKTGFRDLQYFKDLAGRIRVTAGARE